MGFELTTMWLPILAYFMITFMPKLACFNYFQKVTHSLSKYSSRCGSYKIGQFCVSVHITIENCMSIYFINDPILVFPAKNLNLWACFKAFGESKIMQKNIFTLNFNMQISKIQKHEKGFRLPIYHCVIHSNQVNGSLRACIFSRAKTT